MNKTKKLSVSICIPAYNEEKNAINLLKALTTQTTKKIYINKIVFISSGSTDRTNELVEQFAKTNDQIIFIKEAKRTGKAAAINLFLKHVHDPVVVIQSADTLPEVETIERLCEPFVDNHDIGMTGGAPIPVDDPDTFLGYIVHAWWWFHRNIPRFGEIVAFRNVLKNIPKDVIVDEAYIQAKFIQMGAKVVHIDSAVVHNKGADNIRDLIVQRRRNYIGHVRLFWSEGIKIDSMTKSSLYLLLFKFKIPSIKHAVWLISGIMIEVYSQLLGWMDISFFKKTPYIWNMATSTKNLRRKNNNYIVFVNFAPINFMGGAERWFLNLHKTLKTKEHNIIYHMTPSLANIYAQLVLKRKFDQRRFVNYEEKDIRPLGFAHFIPFTHEWKKTRKDFHNARIIYMKFEIMEFLITYYFGGSNVFKKTVAGFHSPFIYQSTLTFFDRLHNLIYGSFISKWMLNRMKKIHVLNKRDSIFLKQNFHLKNIILVPNAVDTPAIDNQSLLHDQKKLNIIFVGELSERKGVDILSEVIKKSPSSYTFHIVGDGPLKSSIKVLNNKKNVIYHGYLDKTKLNELYQKCEIFFLPSRAEGMPLVILEAMANGLKIVNSMDITLGLPKFIEYSSKEVRDYLKIFDQLNNLKDQKKLHQDRLKIRQFFKDNFSYPAIYPKLFREVLEVS